MSCDTCNWNYANQCISELGEAFGHSSQYTSKCIGYLDKDLEEQLWNTYDECIKLLSKRKLGELIEIKLFILNQREGERKAYENKRQTKILN